MSRKGKTPIQLPKGVEVKINGQEVSVKGPKGTLKQEIGQEVSLDVQASQILVALKEEYAKESRLHGLYRSLLNNMVLGVASGFEKRLQMIGVGYRAAVKGSDLDLSIGKSHPTVLKIPQGVQVVVEKNTMIIISGLNSQAVGQFAAEVRAMRPPEPYQGKGIRYEKEYVRKKAGKSAAKK
jgi:large subunit ribosomal protein L6